MTVDNSKFSSRIGDVGLDVLLSEKYTASAVTTDHPVEEGADPTDHVRKVPGKLQIEAIITNSPIPYDASRGPLQEGRLGYATRQFKILEAQIMGAAIEVETPARKYKNMQITELVRTRDSKLGTDTIQFTCQLKEIVFVNTDTARLEQVSKTTSIPKTPTAKEHQSKKPATEVRASTADKIGHAVEGLVVGF